MTTTETTTTEPQIITGPHSEAALYEIRGALACALGAMCTLWGATAWMSARHHHTNPPLEHPGYVSTGITFPADFSRRVAAWVEAMPAGTIPAHMKDLSAVDGRSILFHVAPGERWMLGSVYRLLGEAPPWDGVVGGTWEVLQTLMGIPPQWRQPQAV